MLILSPNNILRLRQLTQQRHQRPRADESDNRRSRHHQRQWNAQELHQQITWAHKEIMHAIDAKAADRQIRQGTTNLLRIHTNIPSQQKDRNRHHHHIRRAIRKEQLHALFRYVWISNHVTETHKSNKETHYKHRQTKRHKLTESRLLHLPKIMTQQQITVETRKIIQQSKRVP